jgi:hypothetical protein
MKRKEVNDMGHKLKEKRRLEKLIEKYHNDEAIRKHGVLKSKKQKKSKLKAERGFVY